MTDRHEHDSVLSACPSGPASGIRRQILKTAMTSAATPLAARAAAWVCDLLYGQIGPEAASAFAVSVGPGVWDRIESDLLGTGTPTAAVVGGRFVAVPGSGKVFDCESGVWTADRPDAWLETRVFNVRELVKRCDARMRANDALTK